MDDDDMEESLELLGKDKDVQQLIKQKPQQRQIKVTLLQKEYENFILNQKLLEGPANSIRLQNLKARQQSQQNKAQLQNKNYARPIEDLYRIILEWDINNLDSEITTVLFSRQNFPSIIFLSKSSRQKFSKIKKSEKIKKIR